MKKKNNIFLSIGTNIGNRMKNISECVKHIKENNIVILANSAIYETEPLEYKNQEYFYNMVIKVNTNYSPEKLLKILKNIENKMGREKTIRFGPRIIDIDILIYNDIIIKYDNLHIPHKEISNRYFILQLINEIDNIVIPGENRSIKEIIKKKNFKQKIKKVEFVNFTQEIL